MALVIGFSGGAFCRLDGRARSADGSRGWEDIHAQGAISMEAAKQKV